MFDAFFDLVDELLREPAGDHFDELCGFFMQMTVGVVGDQFVEVIGDRTDVFGDRPFVVVQHNDESFCIVGDIVQRFVACTTGECSVSGNNDDIPAPASPIPGDRHSQCGGERRARVTGPIAVVLTFAAKQKSIQTLVLANRVEPIPPSGQQFVNIALVTDIKYQLVRRRIEDPVKRYRQFDDAEIWSEMSSDLRKNGYKFVPNLLCELRKLYFIEPF